MSENCQDTLRCNPQDLQQAMAIHTNKITDSCRDKDCIEDLRVYLTRGSQSLLDSAASARVRCAELLYTYIDVEPVAFDRNHYCIDVTFYYRILADAVCFHATAAEGERSVIYISGLGAVYRIAERRVILDRYAERHALFLRVADKHDALPEKEIGSRAVNAEHIGSFIFFYKRGGVFAAIYCAVLHLLLLCGAQSEPQRYKSLRDLRYVLKERDMPKARYVPCGTRKVSFRRDLYHIATARFCAVISHLSVAKIYRVRLRTYR